MTKMVEISAQDLVSLQQRYQDSDKSSVIRRALAENDLTTIAKVDEAKAKLPNVFNVEIKTHGITSQFQSGRCWLFSATNVLREALIDRYHIEGNFELSQNYLAFYDKLEKANWFMECALLEIDSPYHSEKLRYLLDNAVGDGGQWNMLVSLVEKYGIVPKSAYPETYMAGHTASMNQLLNRRLRKFVVDIKTAKKQNRQEELIILKDQALREVYSLIASCFGLPPKSFDFVYYDQDHQAHQETLTPKQLYAMTGLDLKEYVNVIHSPTSDKPYYQTYEVEYLGNVVGGEKINLLNLPLDVFKQVTIQQLKDGQLTWFGCDCSKDADRKQGLWDTALFDYENAFDIDLEMSKEEMLDSHESAMNHAMVLTGVHLENEQPTRWKIENSWGDKIGQDGYFIASDQWFDTYVYVVAIHKKYLPKQALEALEKPSVLVAPWDPFGTLAK